MNSSTTQYLAVFAEVDVKLIALAAFFVSVMYVIRFFLRQPSSETDRSLIRLPATDGLFLQVGRPSGNQPKHYQLPGIRNFSGAGSDFLFSPSADLAARLLLEILDAHHDWAGVSQERLMTHGEEGGGFNELSLLGVNHLLSRGMLRREWYLGQPVYFVTVEMLTEIARDRLRSP